MFFNTPHILLLPFYELAVIIKLYLLALLF
jgi:hypothetical protein